MSRNTRQRKARSSADLQTASPPAAILDSTWPASIELDAVASYWARLGVLFGVRQAHEQVDVELLVCDTARVAPYDERLFVCAVSWVARYHAFVNGRRLSALAASLDSDASPVLGALLSVAGEAAGGAPELEAARERCRPLAKPQPLFAAMRSMRVLSERVRRNALPVFAAWGLWHDDQTLKPAAIRPLAWLLNRVPELRVRSLLGPSVEADLMARALADNVTVREVARVTLTSYAAVHGAADRLVWRGLLVRERVAQSQLLRPTDFARDVLGGSGLALGRNAVRRDGARTRRSAAGAISPSSKRAV